MKFYYLLFHLLIDLLIYGCNGDNANPKLLENTIRFIADGQEYESSSTHAEVFCETFNEEKLNYSINFHSSFQTLIISLIISYLSYIQTSPNY